MAERTNPPPSHLTPQKTQTLHHQRGQAAGSLSECSVPEQEWALAAKALFCLHTSARGLDACRALYTDITLRPPAQRPTPIDSWSLAALSVGARVDHELGCVWNEEVSCHSVA